MILYLLSMHVEMVKAIVMKVYMKFVMYKSLISFLFLRFQCSMFND